MQTKSVQIIPAFAPDVQFDVKPVVQPTRPERGIHSQTHSLMLPPVLTERHDSIHRFFRVQRSIARRSTVITKLFLTLSLLMPLPMIAEPATIVFQSGPDKTALLELYTSEGCSSCPPAEKWLSGLKNSPRLWKDFVPVAFHVDYWDHLGWRDSLADSGNSDRQRSYAESWHSESVYTPAFVVNGKEWLGWPVSKDGPSESGPKVGVLTANSSEPDRWKVVFQPVGTTNATYEVHAALLANSVSSDVKGGENRGRRLSHDFAVTRFVTVPMRRVDGTWQGQFVLSQPSNHPATDAAIAIWVTETEKLEAVQAVGGWLGQPISNK